MSKKIIIVIIILGVILAATIYYFFALRVEFTNRTKHNLSSVDCKTNAGKHWKFLDIAPDQSLNRVLLVNSGSVLKCVFNVKGYTPDSSLITGYFNENISKISIVLCEQGDNVIVKIAESGSRREKIRDTVILRKEKLEPVLNTY